MRGLKVALAAMAVSPVACTSNSTTLSDVTGPAATTAAPTPPEARAPRGPLELSSSQADRGDGTSCEWAKAVSPRALSAAWPTMVGKRVSFVGHIERSLEFAEALVVADGARFDVMLSPSDVWTGSRRRTYRVIGSATVRVAGQTRLPQLLVENGDCSDQ